jgi:putative MATE family efflux protein
MSGKSTTTEQIRDFTQGKIFNQLIALAMPLMAISFIQMTYNLVDIMWIGRLGSRSVAAVGTIGMIMWMMNSLALTSKVSAEISIGQSVGAKRIDQAVIYASHTTTLAILLGVSFALLFIVFPHPFVSFFKLQHDIAAEAVDYLRIVAFGLPFSFLILNFSGICVGLGRSDIPFYFNGVGLVLNIILDPVFIFGVGPFPALGSAGAAVATCISQLVVAMLFVYHLKRKNGLLGKFPFFARFHRRYIYNILKLGLPVAAMNMYFSFISMNLARIASIYGGHLGVTSQTTGGQIEGITWNTSQGFSTALGGFVAQNYAARRMDRAWKAYHYTLLMMGILGMIVSLAFILKGENIFALFIPEKAAYEAGGHYLFVMGISQLFMMLELTTQGMFNGIGKTTIPAVISIGFNTLRIPLAVFLAGKMGISGVWWAICVSSILKGIVSPTCFYFFKRKIRSASR